ncbi:hypothetical protein [uncultured Tateyamaria sp.]|uniref:hypothetical protein n=1 Tax=uncultured Tateyamaria sp. TaxID=455651 RepID=UPI002626EFBB|nr:hypothetical protein [uncultured Tateyamaria sp.]
MTRLFALYLIASTTLPTLALAQTEIRRERFQIPIFALDANTFEVIENDGAGGSDLWCAAGIYVRTRLGQRGGDITILSPLGPAQSVPGRRGVVFSTADTGEAISSFSEGVRRAGKRFSMTHAYALCRGVPNLRVRIRDDRL